MLKNSLSLAKRFLPTIMMTLLVPCAFADDSANTTAASNVPQAADPFIIKIELRNPDSSRESLGDGIRYITDKEQLGLYTQFYNSTGHELLTLFAGSTLKFKRSFKGYEIAHSEKAFLMARRHLRESKNFETGKGIHLGLSESAVEKILGKPDSSEDQNGTTVIKYNLNDATTPFMQTYKATTYGAEYRFTHGELVDAKVMFDEGKN